MASTVQALTQSAQDLLQKATSDLSQTTTDQPEAINHEINISFVKPEATEAVSNVVPPDEEVIATAHALMQLWYERRHNEKLSHKDAEAMLLPEIHRYKPTEQPQSSRADGSDLSQDEQIIAEIQQLQHYIVTGQSTLTRHGQFVQIALNGPYINASFVSKRSTEEETESRIVGVLFSPGPWFFQYETALQ